MIATLTRQIGVVAALGFLAAGTARADSWNERTILTFSDAVMIPGATLQPGKYIFKLLDTSSSRQVVQVLRAEGDGNEQVALTQAVPLKRAETKGDIVLRFNPTEAGHPPAIKAWFYPGSIFGHQFVYPDEQARVIAERTKTVVLAIDQPGTDLEKGTLHLYDASGNRAEWKSDDRTMQEWESWRRTREPGRPGDQETKASTGDADERRAGNAVAFQTDREGLPIDLDDLEDHPTRYLGKKVSVDAEVERVLGPRMFTIDEPNWGDLDGEVFVHMPSSLAALVGEGDRVTVTGEVKRAVTADLEREWGWMGFGTEAEAEFSAKPVIMASRIVGGDSSMAVLIEAGKPVPRIRTDRGGTEQPLTNVNDVALGDDELVGRRVTLTGIRVDELSAHGGFFVEADSGPLFVLPADGVESDLSSGQTITVEGVVLEAPRNLALQGDLPQDTNDDIYVLATNVTG
jgi:hypothetical protein